MKRLRLVSSLWLPVVLVALPAGAQSPGAAPARAGGVTREPSRMQMNIMEGILQNAVEEVQGRALEALQRAAGMPAMFTLDSNSRARAFRLPGYGVFFDVDLPPIPRSVEWSFRVLDTGAVLVGDINQLQEQIDRMKDPRTKQDLLTIVTRMQARLDAASNPSAGSAGQLPDNGTGPNKPRLVDTRTGQQADPFRSYVDELKRTLEQVMIEYGPTIQIGADDWLHVAAREMSPKLMPGNPTEATIDLRVKGSTLAALKAGQLTADQVMQRIEVKEIF